MGKLSDKKIAFILAPNDFSDEQYFQPKVLLQAQGAMIDTFSKNNPEEVTGIKGGKAHITASLKELNPEEYDAIVIVGGKGAKKYFNDKKIHKIIKTFADAGKIISAISSGSVVLANAGVLSGKEVTSLDVNKSQLINKKANWTDKKSVVDGNVITSQGSQTSMDFGMQIVNSLAD